MKIEKCPFCGGIGTLWSIDQCDTVYAVCQDCGARTVDYKHAEEAIAAWNSRTAKDTNVPTNADRIRGMSDGELAKELTRNPAVPCRTCEHHDGKLDICRAWASDFTCVVEYAEALALDWLKQPAETEGTE